MLPYIALGIVAVGVSVMMDNKEKEMKKKYKKKISARETAYTSNLKQTQLKYNNRKKASLFQTIKKEQSKLKKERRLLYAARDKMARNSSMYEQLTSQIKSLTSLIERKQRDADKMRIG